MKFFLVVLILFCSALSYSAQNRKTDYVEFEKKPKVSKLSLAREDAEGNIIEGVSSFSPKDIPIYCYVDLNTSKPITVKLDFIAVKVKGMRPNSKLISISYKTKNGEDMVTFTGRPEKTWLVGSYRVDILLNGKAASSKTFEVLKPKPINK